MNVVGVVNLKGGTGKTTVATHLAAAFAQRGGATALHDLDRQQNASAWVERRDPGLPVILAAGRRSDPPDVQTLIIDAPAGTRSDALVALVKRAEVILVPVLPSAFDEGGTARFLTQLAELPRVRRHRVRVGLIANRWRTRSAPSNQLGAFLAACGFPVVAHLRDSPLYATSAGAGRAVFELPTTRARALVADWRPLLMWLDTAFFLNVPGEDPGTSGAAPSIQ